MGGGACGYIVYTPPLHGGWGMWLHSVHTMGQCMCRGRDAPSAHEGSTSDRDSIVPA